MRVFEHVLGDLLIAAIATPVGGVVVAVVLRRRGLTWTWALPGLLLGLLLLAFSWLLALCVLGASLLACLVGAVWHHDDLHHGADLAAAARSRVGILRAFRMSNANARLAREGWVSGDWLVVGRDARGMPVSIPVGRESGSHTLVVGATGAGKTVTQAWIAARLVEHGHGAIVSDLVTLVARQQREPVPAVVMIDEFSAVAAEQVARLFGRARSAGISLVLGTQELADLKSAGEALREQTLGNVAAVIAHRQNVPESAELIAAMAGTRPAWITTQQTKQLLFGAGPASKGTRTRGHEFELHPTQVKQLLTGSAAVVTPGSGHTPTVARICHPDEAHTTRSRRRSYS
jgi:hypothetical protein